MSAIVAFFLDNSKYIVDNLKVAGVAVATLISFLFIRNNVTLKVKNELLNLELKDEERVVKVQNEIIQVVDEYKDTSSDGVIELMRKDKL